MYKRQEIGFIKNKYIGRTFIAPGQKSREDKVKIKLNPIAEVAKGKRIVMIDDSIVRGTTSARIVKLLREAGAKEIHKRVSAPPFMNPCYYGTDIDSRENLIACKHSVCLLYTSEIYDVLLTVGISKICGAKVFDGVHGAAVKSRLPIGVGKS